MIALIIMLAVMAIATIVSRRYVVNLEQWSLAGRGLGSMMIWLLMAGEIYTAFSLLGASGGIYRDGAAAYYILAYLTLSPVVGFFVLPRLASLARSYGVQSQADLFRVRFDSDLLARIIAVIGIAFSIPYIQIQFTGLGIMIEFATRGQISYPTAILIAGIALFIPISLAGVRGIAWMAVIKDLLLLLLVVFLAVVVTHHFFKTPAELFNHVKRMEPSNLTISSYREGHGQAWFSTTVMLMSIGCYMWPHLTAVAFTAKSGDALRKGMAVLPLYTLTLPFVFLIGFAARVHESHLSNADGALFQVSSHVLDQVELQFVGGIGSLAAVTPAALLVLTTSVTIVNNILVPIHSKDSVYQATERTTKIVAALVLATSMLLALSRSTTLSSLLLFGYAGITQLFPGMVIAAFSSLRSHAVILLGLAAGIAFTCVHAAGYLQPICPNWNSGFVGLCANTGVTLLGTVVLVVRRQRVQALGWVEPDGL